MFIKLIFLLFAHVTFFMFYDFTKLTCKRNFSLTLFYRNFMTLEICLGVKVNLSCLQKVDTVHNLMALLSSVIKSSQLRQPVPIFGIPCIPLGYKIPIVFPCLAPQEKFSVVFLLDFVFSLKKRNNQIRDKSEHVNGVLLNSHKEKRQWSRSLGFRIKSPFCL